MARSTNVLATLLFISGAFVLLPATAFAAFPLRIIETDYRQDFNPGETATFIVRVKNTGNVATGAELVITLTSTATNSVDAADVGSPGTVAGGATFTFTVQVNLATFSPTHPEGVYTVRFTLLDGDGARADRLTGPHPVKIGTNAESIQVFPETLNLGTIPPGRYMHPVPVEVRWNFYRYNRLRQDQPFVVRLYTDNAPRYHGIKGALRRGSPSGLVSTNGRFEIPIKIWTLNFGPDIQESGWDSALAGPPPVDDDTSWIGPPLIEDSRHYGGSSWVRIKDRSELGVSPFGWTRGEGMIGQDPHDVRYVNEKNPLGDFTLKSPFTFYLATEGSPTAVEGQYTGTLIVEIWSP